MRAKVKKVSADTALLRILDALAREAVEASDEEVTQAAADLRMDLGRGGSAAFAGLTYFAHPQPTDFFDVEALKGLAAPAGRIMTPTPPTQPRSGRRRSKRLPSSTQRKPPGRE